MKEKGNLGSRQDWSIVLQAGGFTFTELLVAISLGAILVGTMLPALNTAQDTMKAAVCLGNMHQWGMAISLYVADQRDYYPFDGDFNDPPCAPPNTNAWFNVLPPYINQSKLCDLYTANTPPRPGMKSIWICPSATNTTVLPTMTQGYFTYALNACLHEENQVFVGFRRSRMVSPATTIIFCESPDDGSTFGAQQGNSISETATSGGTYSSASARHSGGMNFVLGDGHVEWINIVNYCRLCPSYAFNWDNSTITGDWSTRAPPPYHWWFAPNISTASQ